MNRNAITYAIVIIATFGCATKTETMDMEKDISLIKELSAKRAKAFNDGNAQIIANAFTEEGLLMAPGSKSMSGKEAVRAYYQHIFDQYATSLESGYQEVTVSGDYGYGIGFAKVTLVPHHGGDTLYSTSKYVNIVQRQEDGSWLTTHDIWNGNE